jgi:hypothetical protein
MRKYPHSLKNKWPKIKEQAMPTSPYIPRILPIKKVFTDILKTL